METVAPTWSSAHDAWNRVFNSPIECGLRVAIILSEIYPEERDLQQLIQLDYLLVHSGDLGDGPPSIHPAHPYRASELHLRRPLVEQGLAMMLSKSIIECSMTPSGIAYRAGTWSLAFLNDLQSAYTQQLKISAKWIASKYTLMPPQELASKLKSQFQQWGAEFSPTTLALTESH